MARWLGFYARRRHFSQPRAVRLRLALESLGPIFVKFGQMLSTRRDLLAPDFADELAKLQDRVPPFDSALAMAEIERGLGMPIAEAYSEFDPTPVASASVAQVHFARLHDGRDVAVKVLRPGMHRIVDHDIDLLDTFAQLIERFSEDGRRLKPREVVAELPSIYMTSLTWYVKRPTPPSCGATSPMVICWWSRKSTGISAPPM